MRAGRFPAPLERPHPMIRPPVLITFAAVSVAVAVAGCGSSAKPSSSGRSSGYSQRLEYVVCMRLHGVPNLPDPSASGTAPSGTYNSFEGIVIPTTINMQSPAFLRRARVRIPATGRRRTETDDPAEREARGARQRAVHAQARRTALPRPSLPEQRRDRNPSRRTRGRSPIAGIPGRREGLRPGALITTETNPPPRFETGALDRVAPRARPPRRAYGGSGSWAGYARRATNAGAAHVARQAAGATQEYERRSAAPRLRAACPSSAAASGPRPESARGTLGGRPGQ